MPRHATWVKAGSPNAPLYQLKNFKHPVCLAGANACPPEDCGGIWGDQNLPAILADAKHPEHEAMKDWMGGELNAEQFSVERVNQVLKQIIA